MRPTFHSICSCVHMSAVAWCHSLTHSRKSLSTHAWFSVPCPQHLQTCLSTEQETQALSKKGFYPRSHSHLVLLPGLEPRSLNTTSSHSRSFKEGCDRHSPTASLSQGPSSWTLREVTDHVHVYHNYSNDLKCFKHHLDFLCSFSSSGVCTVKFSSVLTTVFPASYTLMHTHFSYLLSEGTWELETTYLVTWKKEDI